MAQKNISFGSFPNDPDSDAIRTAFQKVQENFNEVYAGVENKAVSSINRIPGQGITVNSPTGNVTISANLACVQVSTFTLSVSRDTPSQNPTNQNTFLNSSVQTLHINLPTTITNVSNINLSGTLIANNITSNSNLSANIANFTSINGTLTTATQPNITSLGTLSNLSVSGNANISILNVTGNIIGANVTTTKYLINSIQNGIIAVGTTQETATPLSNTINIVSSVTSGSNSVVLPEAIPGMTVYITNTSANVLNVFPAPNAAINTNIANAAILHNASTTLHYIASSTTQWYTVNAA